LSGRVFLDTNVLVYADDLDAGEKQVRAREILQGALTTNSGVVSTRFDLVLVRLELILGAIDLHRLNRISFWDALIVKCAAAAGCRRLITEDLHHGQVIDGVQIENPFRS